MPDQTAPVGQVVDRATLRRLANSWPRRATVRTDLEALDSPDPYDPLMPDYPPEFVPFGDHPDFLAATPEQRSRVLTLAWLNYNERVVSAEEYVANPAFAMIMHGEFPGMTDPEIRKTVQQAHIDETWHTYLHMLASQRTRDLRGITEEPDYPHAVTYQRLMQAWAAAPERWHRKLLTFVWAAVAEVSVNAYLSLLSTNETIQPLHSLVPRLHSRDESAHSSMMVEVSKALYLELTREQRAAFCAALPSALRAFSEQDYGAWRLILDHCEVIDSDTIISDVESRDSEDLLVRDFSGLRRLVQALELEDRVDFAFPADGPGEDST